MPPIVIRKAFIDGEWRPGKNGDLFQIQNPATGKLEATVADCSAGDAVDAIDAAHRAFQTWRKILPRERSALLLKIETKMMAEQTTLANLLTLENGKPLAESMAEVAFSASFFNWFAGECRRIYGDYIPSPMASKQLLHIREPIGVAAMIAPWNFPIGMVARKVAAALAAGCTCVVKPAENTPLTALLFAELVSDILPPGVINIVPCSRQNAQAIGEVMCSSPLVKIVSFTGSTEVGKWIYERCAPTLKRVSLELGGNAPFIIFPSANMKAATDGAMAAKFRNSGQTCVTANRFFVASTIYDDFSSRLHEAMKETLKLGNGLDTGVNQGPLINQRQYEKVKSLVDSAISEGCTLVCGGSEPHPLGRTFFRPTLLTGGRPEMKICTEEIFGPVFVLIPFETEEEVIRMANDTSKGLAGYFYSEDISQVWRVARSLEVGMVGVNEPMLSTCEAAFGGIKESGIGKEGSKYGLEEYTQTKYICFGNLQQ